MLTSDLAMTDAPVLSLDPDAARWQALRTRDAGADGSFVYSVKTTGVYCRPSCAARPARPENVAFHPTCEAAEAAGFRPCKRCRPNEAGAAERNAALVAAACQAIDRAIEAGDPVPALDALAQAAGFSPYHFHRLFKATAGVTPKAYAARRQAERARAALEGEASVTEAIYEGGYSSPSRFYERAAGDLGMTPTAYRSGGRGEVIRFALGQCSLGAILVAATERGVCAITLGDHPESLLETLQDRFPKATLVGGDAGFETWVAAVVGFVEAPRAAALDLPLDVRGTAFQEKVWRALREIPVGATSTYTEVAERIGMPTAVRAVALACGANPTALAIPCHRVIRTDGSLSGYRWGIERKRALLAREAA